MPKPLTASHIPKRDTNISPLCFDITEPNRFITPLQTACASLSSEDETNNNDDGSTIYFSRPHSNIYGKAMSMVVEAYSKRISSSGKRRTTWTRRRSSSAKSHKSEPITKNILFGSLTRRIKLDSTWLAPLSPIPFRQSGIAWNGVFRRIPVLIFSPTAMMSKDSSVKSIGQKLNLASKITKSDCRLLRTLLKSHGFSEVPSISNDYNLLWTTTHIKPMDIKSLTEFQRVNHFPKSYELTRKDRLANNIKRMQSLKGMQHFDIIPKTYVLPNEHAELRTNYLKDHGPYIVKPVASSRGRGIYIISSPDQVVYTEQIIVSRYVTNPLLIDGFKFDLRLYVAVTSYSPLVIYIYEEGLARFATVRYQKGSKHFRNLCMHLTNYSVNKKNHHFVHNDDADVEDFGNKWSLGALLRYLRSEGKDTAGLMLRIEDIIIKALISVEEQISQSCRLFLPSKFSCFELYGFDIIIDDNLRPWLLEINLSPSLACDTPLDFKVKSNMLSDLLNLAGIVCCDPTKRNKRSVPMLPGLPNFTTPKHPTYFVPAHSYNVAESHERSASNTPRRVHSSSTDTPRLTGSANCTASLSKLPSKISHSSEDLSAEELRLIRRFQEETARCGGWLRIFPSAETWEQYAGLLNCSVRVATGDPPPPQWRFSMSTTTPVPSNSTSSSAAIPTSKTSRMPGDTFGVHASAALAISAMHKANLLTLKTSFDNSDKDVTFVHPNLIPPKVDLGLFTGLSESRFPGNDDNGMKQNEEKLTHVFLPALQGNSSVFASIHSLDPCGLAESLMIVLGFDLDESRQRREDSYRVAACYSQTLSRLPFYHRKLGALPMCIRGVCLVAGCGHNGTGKSRFCGMRMPPETCAETYSLKAQSLIAQSPCASQNVALNASDELAQIYRKKTPRCRLNEVAVKSMSQLQVRNTFCAYLSRIHAGLVSQVREATKKGEVPHSKKADEQMDLMLRFLQKAALNLSNKAVTAICCGGDVEQSLFTHGVFMIPSFPPNAKIQLKQKILVRLLDIFIRIYMYDTTLKCSETDVATEVGVEPSRFSNFIQNATENELESVLSQYTRIYHSVSLFIGSLSGCASSEQERNPHPDTVSQTNSNKPQLRSWTSSCSLSMPEHIDSIEEKEFILVPQTATALKPLASSGRMAKHATRLVSRASSPNVRKMIRNGRKCSVTPRRCSGSRSTRYASPSPQKTTPKSWSHPRLDRTRPILRQAMEAEVPCANTTESDGDFEAAYYDPAGSMQSMHQCPADREGDYPYCDGEDLLTYRPIDREYSSVGMTNSNEKHSSQKWLALKTKLIEKIYSLQQSKPTNDFLTNKKE